jgi:hypothetical protein
VSFDEWPFGYRAWSPPDAKGLKDPNAFVNSGVLVARIDEDTFLVTGKNARIEFQADPNSQPHRKALMNAEEVRFEDGAWLVERRWNGDQTDYGLNFTDLALTFRVSLGSYPAKSESRSLPKAL